jgi:hypothetical protein
MDPGAGSSAGGGGASGLGSAADGQHNVTRGTTPSSPPANPRTFVFMPRKSLYLAASFVPFAMMAVATKASTGKLVCRVDLEGLGQEANVPSLGRTLQFLDDTTVAVALLVRNSNAPRLLRRGEEGLRSPYFLSVALVGVTTGRILEQARWPTNSPSYSGLLAARGSEVLVQCGNQVRLYGKNLELVRQLTLPPGPGFFWENHVSPTGATALFVHFNSFKRPSTWAWIDTRKMLVLHLWRDLETGNVAVSDNAVAMANHCFSGVIAMPCSVLVRSFAQRVGYRIRPAASEPEFVNSETLFIRGRLHRSASVVNLARRKVVWYRGPTPEREFIGPALPATDGDRFVVPILADDEITYLYLFRAPFTKPDTVNIPYISLAGKPGEGERAQRVLALSPSGTRLAVLEDFKTLEIFDLAGERRGSGGHMGSAPGRNAW